MATIVMKLPAPQPSVGFYARRPQKVYARSERVGTRGGMIQTRNATMIACHWHVRILLYQGTPISRDDDAAHKVYLTRLSEFPVFFDVSSWDSQIISQVWRHQPRAQ
jgi:hypothetical protein